MPIVIALLLIYRWGTFTHLTLNELPYASEADLSAMRKLSLKAVIVYAIGGAGMFVLFVAIAFIAPALAQTGTLLTNIFNVIVFGALITAGTLDYRAEKLKKRFVALGAFDAAINAKEHKKARRQLAKLKKLIPAEDPGLLAECEARYASATSIS